MTGPLAGVRVVVLAGMGPVPFTAMLLAHCLFGLALGRRTEITHEAIPATGPTPAKAA